MKNQKKILKSTIIVTCLIVITLWMNFLCVNNINAASVNDVKGLGENTLNSSGVLGELEIMSGAGGTEGWNENRFNNFNSALYRIWGVILVVLQIASIVGIIFTGLKYMFSSADAKADLKKSMISLVIGMVIVFGASSVVGFVTGAFNEIFQPLK